MQDDKFVLSILFSHRSLGNRFETLSWCCILEMHICHFQEKKTIFDKIKEFFIIELFGVMSNTR